MTGTPGAIDPRVSLRSRGACSAATRALSMAALGEGWVSDDP